MLLPQRMESNSWAMDAAPSACTGPEDTVFFHRSTTKPTLQLQVPPPTQPQPAFVKQTLAGSSPSIALDTPVPGRTPLLPSLGSISPANTTPAARFPSAGAGSLLAPLRRVPEYCRFPGCANFGKMQGYCHDHIHGRPATHQSQSQSMSQSPSPPRFGRSTTAPLPSLVLAASQPPQQPPQQYLPGLRSVVGASSAPVFQSNEAQPTTPVYAVLGYNKRPLYRDPSAFLPVTKKPRVLSSPTPSSSSVGVGGGQHKQVAKCRREGCTNDARRKGLCMEHGGRHFCKMAGCQKCAHRGGFCISHGGGRRCAVANCSKSAQSGGICYSHGGGKRCATDGCTHAARSGGFCIKHGKQQQQMQQMQRQA